MLFLNLSGSNSGIFGRTPSAAYFTDNTGTQQAVTKTKSASSNEQQATGKKKPAAAKPKPAVKKNVKSTAIKSQKGTISTKQEKGTVIIGTQKWASANLDVITFRNGDTIQEARTNAEWVAAGKAGKPAWCYYNNDTVAGKRYGKLYNWYAVNDPRGLAPEGWKIPGNEDWFKLVSSLGGSQVAGLKMKSTTGWNDGNNGTNESDFAGLPGGYRVENGSFINAGKIGIWWSSAASHSSNAFDYYLFMSTGLGRSTNQASRGESVRCLMK
ncbi:MAG TPA: fibrobacter succinogenes major paralogous domain-containing protein [Bacteroidales bacterium]|nr:fibrobacter succinogenes major paralogous domain-containing protein [Bacteroidales bacterium]